MAPILSRLGNFARGLKSEIGALRAAAGDKRPPWHASALAIIVIGFALSSIDLIPDFVPVLGVLDDLLLVPLGLWAVRWLMPEQVLDERRRRAAVGERLPVSRRAGAIIVTQWAVGALATALWLWRSL